MIKKNILKFFIILLLFMLFTCANKAFEPEKNNTAFQDNTAFPSHPRILLFEGEENIIQDNIDADPVWRSVHTLIINECAAILGKATVERVLEGKRLLSVSREALKRIFYLSYAYRMTRSKTYLDRAVQEMKAVADFSDWNPSHFLDVAEMTMGVAIGYDWLYNEMDENSKTQIRNAIINKGLKESYNSSYNWFLTSSNNWNQVCNAGMTYGALAIYENDPVLAENVINRAAESVKIPMQEYYPDGAYPEGYGYWGYGTSFNVMFISAWEKVYRKTFDVPQNTSFLKTGKYLLHMSGPSLSSFNYADCGTGTGLNIAMFWFGQRTGDFSILYTEKTFLSKLKSASDRLLPAVLLWSKGLKISQVTSPAQNMYVGHGKNPVALMRSSWSDANAVYAGIKGGSPKSNHAHMDAGSFVMEASGVRWASDLGMDDYNKLETAGIDLWNMTQNSERWTVFRYNNLVHNTLTVNGQYQKVDGSAEFISYSSAENMMNAVTDISTVYSGQLKSAVRGIAVIDKQYVTVRDEIETTANSSTIRWTLLTSAAVELSGPDYATLSKNGKTLTLKVAGPASVTMKTWPTTPVNSWDSPNTGTIMVGFEITVPANTKTALQVYLIPGGVVQNPSSIPGALSTWPK